jgi:DNA-binding transcriptional MerR regulator
MHGHHTMPMTTVVERYNQQGFYTISQVARQIGVGATTLRRYEGKLFPKTEKLGRNRARLFTKQQIEVIRRNLECQKNKRFKKLVCQKIIEQS